MIAGRARGGLVDASDRTEIDLRYGRRMVVEHERLEHLLRTTIEAAGGVRHAGLVNRLSERLDQHYFDVRRHVGATGVSDEWVEVSLRHLCAATFDIQVGRDLYVAQRHLEAHNSSCPVLDHRCRSVSNPGSR